MPNEKYRNRRDRRKRYELTGDEVLEALVPSYQNNPGISFWGGHGNDPYTYSLATKKSSIDAGADKKTVLIYLELEHYNSDFEFVLNDLIYPLVEYCQEKNANLYIRTKHTFWQSIAYLPMWSRMVSGEFADVFVPAMEETTDKSMELSVAGDVAWVTAQTAPNHLRLTLIDSGYINPKARIATVHFHTVRSVKMVDLLDHTRFNIGNASEVRIEVPCGMFRFIDVETKESF